jgi:hypothetical protein
MPSTRRSPVPSKDRSPPHRPRQVPPQRGRSRMPLPRALGASTAGSPTRSPGPSLAACPASRSWCTMAGSPVASIGHRSMPSSGRAAATYSRSPTGRTPSGSATSLPGAAAALRLGPTGRGAQPTGRPRPAAPVGARTSSGRSALHRRRPVPEARPGDARAKRGASCAVMWWALRAWDAQDASRLSTCRAELARCGMTGRTTTRGGGAMRVGHLVGGALACLVERVRQARLVWWSLTARTNHRG